MKKCFSIIFAIILSVTCIISLVACNKNSQTVSTKDLGTYYKVDGTDLDPDSFIELKSGNKWYDGEFEGKFTIKDGKITLYDGDDELMSGTVSDGVLTLNFMGMETVYKKSSTSIGSDKVDSSAMIKSIDGGQVDGLNVSLEIGDTVEDVDLSGMITTSKDCSWQLYLSRSATAADAIATKIIVPKKGVNTYYIVVTSADNKTNRTYTLNVWKNYYATLSFYANDRLYTTEEVLTHTTYGEGPSCSVDGYKFKGWGCEGYYVVEDKSFSAQLEPLNYSISFDTDGGDDSIKNITATFNEECKLPKPRKTGYIFMGWTYDGNTYENVLHYSFTTDIKLTAKWAIRSYKVVVRSDDETRGTVNVSAQQKEYNSTINLSATTKTGYIFAGWYETHDYGGGYKKISDQLNCTATIPAYDVRYVAKWSKNTAERNNPSAGRVSSLTSTYKVGDELTFTATTNSGYVWTGWFDGDTKLTDNEKLVVKATAQDKTYTAKWSTIKINRNDISGGSVTNLTSTYKVGDDISCTATTNKQYVWVGWFDGDTKLTGNEKLVVKATAQNKTYTAKWARIEAIGTDDSAGKVSTTYLAYKVGDEFTSTATTNLGYTWLGWFDGDTKVSDSEKLVVKTTAQNKTYKAKWAVNEEMSDFSFESGNDWCKITGLKNKNATEIVIPNYVTNIGNEAFRGCTGLTSITIGNSVTSIGNSAFYGCTGLASVNIGNSVTSIGSYAFKGCTGLNSVTMPDSVTSIGYNAFDGCTGLNSVTMPEGVTSIEKYVFYGCSKLTSITIPERVTSIGNSAFAGCSNLATVNWNAISCTSAGQSNYPIFDGCSKLATVNIGNNVTTIPDYAFKGCSSLTSAIYTGDIASWCAISGLGNIPRNTGFKLTIAGQEILGELVIPEGVTSIGNSAFAGCIGITSITIPNSVTNVGNSSFVGCPIENATIPTCAISSIPKEKLNTVVINGGKSIPNNAFSSFSSLNSVTIPNSVTSIEDNAFSGCSSLTSVNYTGDIAGWCAISGLGNIPRNTGFKLTIEGQEITGELVIPDGVTSIGAGAFYGCSGLTSVTIGSGVTSIGDRAFSGCTGLASITIGNSVTSIEDNAFSGCSSLIDGNYTGDIAGWCAISGLGNIPRNTSFKLIIDGQEIKGELVIPDGVTNISDSVFSGCTGLTSIIIPDSVTSIGKDAFNSCPIENATMPTNAISYVSNAKLTTLFINGGQTIPQRAFEGCTGLTSVTIGNSVTSIGREAFKGCTGLTSIKIPEGVTNIGNDAFKGCPIAKATIPTSAISSIPKARLTTVVINGGGYIGSRAFYDCSSLTSVTIGSGVTSIGDRAFSGCTGLTSITIPNSVTSIGDRAFSGCSSLIEVYNKSTLNIVAGSIDYGWIALYAKNVYTEDGGSKLSIDENDYIIYTDAEQKLLVKYTGNDTELALPNVITSIHNYAFYRCTGLTSITIPEGVTSIGESAFSGCSSLTSVNYTGDIAGWCAISGLGNIPRNTGFKLTIEGQEITGELVIPDGVTSIGAGAFYGCSGLTSVTIGSGVTSIGDRAFSGCTGLTSITIPNSVTSIGDRAFSGCIGLTSIAIGNSVKSIGSEAFRYCAGLTSVTIGNSVTSVGSSAFRDCTGLTSITISNSVTSIGEYAFNSCPIENATMPTNAISYVSNAKLTTLFINGGQTIPQRAFEGCTGLTSVTIGNSVTSIGDRAFSGCTGLTSVTISDSLTSIGDSAFKGCPIAKATIPTSAIGAIEKGNLVSVVINGGESIGYGAFRYCAGLTSVTIGNSVTSIGGYAFGGCSNLATVNWNAISCTSAGQSNYPIFDGCSKLATINIGNNVTTIPDYAFRDCTGLTSITIPNSVTSIGAGAFYGCSGLTSVTIGSGVTSIGSSAFSGCIGLTSITIPNGVTSIGAGAFYGCSGLTSVTIGSGVTSIGDRAFRGCIGLTFITIPNSVARIGDWAFYGCTGLTSITIPDSVTSIGEYAFYGCTGLTSITIPASVTSIGYYAFSGSSSLTIYCETASEPSGWSSSWNSSNRPVVWGHNNISTDSEYDYVVHSDKVYLTKYKGTSTNIIIPNQIDGKDVVGFGEIFKGNTNIRSVTISNSVESIWNDAFKDCRSLTSVNYTGDIAGWCAISGLGNIPRNTGFKLTIEGQEITGELVIPDGVTSIGAGAFYGCSGLTSVTIGSGVTSIGDRAFRGCIGLTFITIPNSVTSIGNWAFDGCTGLTSITIPNSVTSIGAGAFSGCIGLTSITIPNGVTSIGESAFKDCTGLTSVTIGNSVTSIGNSAFAGCIGITSITIPSSVTSIGEYAFRGCDLERIEVSTDNSVYYSQRNCIIEKATNKLVLGCKNSGIPNSVTSIGKSAFEDCTGLKSITIPNSVTSIGDWAFYGCTGLKSITIPNSVTSIGKSAFEDCTGLTSVTIGNSVTSIGDSAFKGCSGLTSITIPDSVTSIGERAFSGCTGLKSITIPASVTSIGWGTFSGCTGLKSIVIPNNVTSIGSSAFANCSSLGIISFKGTKAQWSSIKKGSSWKDNILSTCKVYCTDGTISI